MSTTTSILDFISEKSINDSDKQNQEPQNDLPKKNKQKPLLPLIAKNVFNPIMYTYEEIVKQNDERAKEEVKYRNKIQKLISEYNARLDKLAKVDSEINKNITNTQASYKKSGISLDSPNAKNQLSRLPKDTDQEREDLYREFEINKQQLEKPESSSAFSIFTIPRTILGKLSGFNLIPKL